MRTIALVTLLATGLAAPVAAQTEALPDICGVTPPAPAMDHSTMDHSAHGSAPAEVDAHAALSAGMDDMHSQMMAAMAVEDFDVAFICSMIPHHQGAITMAQAALDHSEDPFVRELAGEIVAAQEAEITAMRAWLVARE